MTHGHGRVAVQKDGKWGNASNMMPPINSTGDDFGIIFKDDNSGYFSSNRVGGKGSDDMWGFALSGLITLDAHFDMRDTSAGLSNGNPVRALIEQDGQSPKATS